MPSRATRHDQGFTLLETLVAVTVIGLVAAAFTTFLVGQNRISSRAARQDTAIQVAVSAMEKARGTRGAALLTGRVACDAVHPCPAPVTEQVTAYLGDARRWDGPPAPEEITVDGVPFHRYEYVATCWQPAATDALGASRACTGTIGAAAYVRFVVAVTWRDASCPGGTCAHVAATLLSAAPVDPFLES